MMHRRQLITGTLGALAATMAWRAGAADAPAGATWFERRHVPIGLQLYTVGDAARQDLDATLAKVAAIGYRTIELAGYHGHAVPALRAAATRHGVKFTSIHVNTVGRPGEPGLDQDLPRLAADLRTLGVTDVVVPMFPMPERLGQPRAGENHLAYLQRVGSALTRDDWLRLAALLNDRGAKLRALGLRLGYHNHNPEFAPLGDTNGLEILLAETAPQEVTFELDVGWAVAAGIDPVSLLVQHTRRFQLMHVKDVFASTKANYTLQQDPTEVGNGQINWQRILPVAFAAGVRKFYVEQEPPFPGDRFASIERSYRYLKAFDA